jgi:hypothetical protein
MKLIIARRFWILAPLYLTLLISKEANAGTVAVDTNIYPASFHLELQSTVQIDNGIVFFTQSDTPLGKYQVATLSFSVPIGVSSIDYSLNAPPYFGAFKSFSSAHQSFIGTYNGGTGLVVLLNGGDYVGKSFSDVFSNVLGGASEQDVIDAVLNFGNDIPGFDLWGMMSNTLDLQPAFSQSGPNTYTLESGALIAFSDGQNVGSVEGGYANPVPEPSSFALLSLGAVGLVIGAYRRRMAAF